MELNEDKVIGQEENEGSLNNKQPALNSYFMLVRNYIGSENEQQRDNIYKMLLDYEASMLSADPMWKWKNLGDPATWDLVIKLALDYEHVRNQLTKILEVPTKVSKDVLNEIITSHEKSILQKIAEAHASELKSTKITYGLLGGVVGFASGIGLGYLLFNDQDDVIVTE